MKKILLSLLILVLGGCAQDEYRLKINNDLAEDHGKSVYFRSNLRSNYAGQIRRTLSQKFSEMGLKAATSPENADLIAIFDIETFYAQTEAYKNTSYANTEGDSVLFTDQEEANSLDYSGNANVKVEQDQTCFTVNVGPKGTSFIKYNSSFCYREVMETEDMLPRVLDIYGKYATYQRADVGVQCIANEDKSISCQPLHDRQQAFVNSFWINKEISDDEPAADVAEPTYDNY